MMRQRGLQTAARSGVHSNASGTATGSSGIISTLAGSVPFQAPITALKTGLGQITGIAQDANGNLFVASSDFRCVLKIDSANNVTVYAGQPLPTGPLQHTGDGGPATAATLVGPTSLAVDAAGNLYIGDAFDYTVRMVSAASGVITTVAGTPGMFGSSPDGTLATSALLDGPGAIAVDASANLFVTEVNVVRRVDHATGLLTTVAGEIDSPTTPPCTQLSATQGCSALSVYLNLAFGTETISINNGNLYVAVNNYTLFNSPPNGSAILIVQLSSGTMNLVAGGAAAGAPSTTTAIGATIYPGSIAVDGDGNIDFVNRSGKFYEYGETIMQLPKNGTLLTTIAGNGYSGSTGDGGPAVNAEIEFAGAIIAGTQGNILLAEPSRIRSISSGGIITSIAGDGADNAFGDGGAAQTAGIGAIFDLVSDTQGNLYLADTNDYVVRKINVTSGVITTIAGNGSFANYGNPNAPATLPGDGGPASATPLGYPESLALDGAGNLYIGDYVQGLRILNLSTGTISTLNSQLHVHGSMAFDGQKTLYLASDENVFAVDTISGAATVLTGTGSTGSGDGGPALSASVLPTGVALDSSGNLYISDVLEDAIRVVNLSTEIIENYTGYDTFRYPESVRNDGKGHLLVADSASNTIRRVDLSTDAITIVAGNGTRGFSGDGGSPTDAMLNAPIAAAVDANGNTYIADGSNDRVRRVVLKQISLTGSLTASSTTVPTGTSVDLTATFTGLTFGISPALGTVTFYDGESALTTPSLTFTGSGNTLTVILTDSGLALGMHSITAQFAGDANYAPVTTNALTITVAAPVPPSFTIAATPGSLTVAQGASGTAVFTLTPAGGFNQAVTFSCGTPLPTGVTCSFSPATITPSGSAAVTSTLTLTTTGTSTAALHAPVAPGATRWWLSGGGVSLACLLLVGLPRRRASWLAIAFGALFLGVGLGCGSGSGSSGGGSNPNATPVGTYSISLSASSGTGTSAVSQAATVSLVVTK